MTRWIAGWIFAGILMPLHAQDTNLINRIAASVQLDSVVIIATQEGFSVEDFIRLVLDDESLYAAFHQLRRTTYRFDTEMEFSHKKGHTLATYIASHRQSWDGNCRWMDTLQLSVDGNFYKGRQQKERYYTYALFDRLFLTHGRVCSGHQENASAARPGSMESHVDGLKTLMFRPGHRANIPLIGRKTEIFSPEMLDAYDFSISSDTVEGNPVYVFTADAKDNTRKNQTVFKHFMTTFHKKDFQVVARAYDLSQKTAAYEFDISMQVRLTLIDGMYFPSIVTYDGSWDIPTRKAENGRFTISLSEFSTQ